MLDWLFPEIALSRSVPSIIPLFCIFKDCFNGLLEVEALNREWRRLPFFKKELGEGKVSVLEFWISVSTLKDGARDSAFVHLPIFLKGIMSSPHSGASAERQFSLLKLVRTPLWSRLLPETISNIMHIPNFTNITIFHQFYLQGFYFTVILQQKFRIYIKLGNA
jgi:hypothetical protein